MKLIISSTILSLFDVFQLTLQIQRHWKVAEWRPEGPMSMKLPTRRLLVSFCNKSIINFSPSIRIGSIRAANLEKKRKCAHCAFLLLFLIYILWDVHLLVINTSWEVAEHDYKWYLRRSDKELIRELIKIKGTRKEKIDHTDWKLKILSVASETVK